MTDLCCVSCRGHFPAASRSQAYTEPICRPCGQVRWNEEHPPVQPPPIPVARTVGSFVFGSAPPAPAPHVYVVRSENGEVLYVGQTLDLAARLRSHRRQRSTWVAEASLVEWEEHATSDDARLRESDLIRRHRPPWNVKGVPGRRQFGDAPGSRRRD